MSREERGYVYVGRYTYARQLKDGSWAAYRGAWSNNGEDGTCGIEVERNDKTKKPLRFDSLEAVLRRFVR